ncbi:MAG TPA: hypothetical protein VNW71_01640 [Thermoanaerobaculia bacterium]|nr:hypothetical protein [Thermoanaerobaculia bacterium]
MTAKLLLGLLLTTTLAASAAPDRPQPTEDPCALARRIAQSPPCLAGSACEALDLWRENFGQPDVFPAGAGQLPPGLASRLPDSEVTLGKVDSYESAFQRLGKASGVEVVLHPGVKGEKVDGQLGSMPVERAWKVLLGLGGFFTHFDGERLLVAKAPSNGPRQLGRSWPSTFDCRVR